MWYYVLDIQKVVDYDSSGECKVFIVKAINNDITLWQIT